MIIIMANAWRGTPSTAAVSPEAVQLRHTVGTFLKSLQRLHLTTALLSAFVTSESPLCPQFPAESRQHSCFHCVSIIMEF
jgi:hypothetical protein